MAKERIAVGIRPLLTLVIEAGNLPPPWSLIIGPVKTPFGMALMVFTEPPTKADKVVLFPHQARQAIEGFRRLDGDQYENMHFFADRLETVLSIVAESAGSETLH